MMDMQTIGLIFAIVGVVVTIGFFALGISGINILRDIRDNKKRSRQGTGIEIGSVGNINTALSNQSNEVIRLAS